MAFVYCDNRWKEGGQNQLPGPGQYQLDRPEVPEKKKSSHHRSPNFKRTNQMETCSDKNMHSKTWYSQQQLQEVLDKNIKFRKQSIQKGKLYRKTTIPKNQQPLEQTQEKQMLFINHSEKNLGLTEKDRWGNMKIIELLKQQKEKQKKNPIKKFSNPSKRNVFTYQTRQQLQSDLQEMEILYNSQRNRNENVFSLKNINREISSKQKQRENNSHQYYLTVNKNINGAGKEEKCNDQLSIQPSAIFKTPLDQTLSKVPTALKDSRPQSIEQSKIYNRQPTVQTATGLSDDLFDDSMEYIEDATPGPGAYNLDTSSLTSMLKQTSGKKIEKFGVTMERFRVNKNKVREAQTFINPVHPTFKKTSQASQDLVGFGKGTKGEKELEPVHNGVFYQDVKSLENVSKKNILKSKNNVKFGFESCQERFDYLRAKRVSSDSEEEIIEYDQEGQAETQKIPSSVFLSKVQRQIVGGAPITQNVDFSGQNYCCIATKVKKQKQFYQDYEIQPVPFMAKDNRFKYEQVPKEEKKQELKLIKIKELNQKKESKKKGWEKGYSFGKEEKKENSIRQCPSPDKYQLEQDWIKRTYNLRFR